MLLGSTLLVLLVLGIWLSFALWQANPHASPAGNPMLPTPTRPAKNLTPAPGAIVEAPLERLTPIPDNLGIGRIRWLPLAPSEFAGIAWLETGLVVGSIPSTAPLTEQFRRLGQLQPDQRSLAPLAVTTPQDAACDLHSDYFQPQRLADGRLSYLLECSDPKDQAQNIRRGTRGHQYLMAFDPHSGQTALLYHEQLPVSLPPVVSGGGYSWNSVLQQGVLSDGAGHVFTVTPDHVAPMQLAMEIVYQIALSPDGKQLAFFGQPDPKTAAPNTTNLYVMDRNGANLRLVMSNVYEPMGLVWSPNSQWLIGLALGPSRTTIKSTWLINVATGEQQLLAGGYITYAAWSPDGKQVAVIQWVNEESMNKQRKIGIIDMQGIIK